MEGDTTDRIARALYRISDRSERSEITREVAQALAAADSGFDTRHFYERAGVEYPEGS
jgi:hypothetical protein